MNISGIVNPLPWETLPAEAKPWSTTAAANTSPDYPDMIVGPSTVQVTSASGNLVTTPNGSLAASITNLDANGNATGTSTNGSILRGPSPVLPLSPEFATAVTIKVPPFQPANLVATHNLTSTYQAPNPDDTKGLPAAQQALINAGPGPIQLPRAVNGGSGVAARDLHEYNANSGLFNGALAVAPFGYTAPMTVSVGNVNTTTTTSNVLAFQIAVTGSDPNNPLATLTGVNGGGAYREFEVDFGVPVDMSMKVVEQTVDLGTLPHTFAIQNGLLGFGQGANAFKSGFLPDPLFDYTLFGADPTTNPSAPYSPFLKKFTVQNLGNVNLWNIRASQKVEVPTKTGFVPGSGFPFQYFGLSSKTVDPRFGILAVGAHPLVPMNNVVPQIITSLDKQYDAAWDNYLVNGPPQFSQPFTVPTPGGLSPYDQYYKGFAGRHTVHKAQVGTDPTQGSVASVPDVPANQYLRPVGDPQPQGENTVVGVAVPLGTPSGTYSSLASGLPFVIFEDHDTNIDYNGVPYVANQNPLTLAPAGPLYGGTDNKHPGASSILTRGNGSQGEATLRVRRILPATPQFPTGRPEYLPYTDPPMNLQVTVAEAALTGDVADRAVVSNAAPVNVASGRLPGIDLVPLIDRSTAVTRPAAALNPAAYRSADGSLHVYFSRNFVGDPNGDFAQPGRPFKLFHSAVVWNPTLGAFVANNPGVPLADATQNKGTWFTAPQEIGVTAANADVMSNTSPFVLQTATGGASLYWVNSQPQPGGVPYNQIFVAKLGPDGKPVDGTISPFLLGYDPSVQRYSPRAVYDSATGFTYLFYYGGTSGRWSLFFSARHAGGDGMPTGAPPNVSNPQVRNLEVPLSLPNAIVSASDPAPVVRDLFVPNSANTVAPVRVVDVYYTGISRATQTPDIYMSRFQVTAPGGLPQLTPLALPRLFGEVLKKPGREAIFRARHISWMRNLNDLASLPVVYIGGTPMTLPNGTSGGNSRTSRWQYDDATGVLYQSFLFNGTESIVYVDAAAGTVRFRGSAASLTDGTVAVDYQPQTLRISDNDAANFGSFTLYDNTVLQPTPTVVNGVNTNAVLRRRAPVPAGRQYMFWQRGAVTGKAPTIDYAIRRVGVDLRSIPVAQGGLSADPTADSIALGPQNAQNGSQTPVVTSVRVFPGVELSPAFEVDVASGKIFVDPRYEGLPVTVTYRRASDVASGVNRTVNTVLSAIDEIAPVGQGATSRDLPLSRSVNEGQPYAYLDLLNPVSAVTRTDPNPLGDPTLVPGRVWLFWSSPRGRIGSQLVNGQDPFPGGYDLYWETLAPAFEPQTPSSLPTK
jgi:hypothetical protein